MARFSTAVISPLEHDGLVVELCCDFCAIAEIREEHGTPMIGFYSTKDLLSCSLTIEEFNSAISLLKEKAGETFGREIL